MAAEYRFAIHADAHAYLDSCPEKIQRQLVEKIHFIVGDPYRPGTKQLEGTEWIEGGLPVRRIRSGKFRILYTVNREENIVTVVDIGPRADIYETR